MKKPNILLISIDTLRADHLSCYGHHRMTSPNIDKIADEGILFENAYSTAGWTPPAHASMLTGLYPSQHNVIDQNRLDGNIPTIAELLSENGYNTAGFVNNSQVGQLVGLDKGHKTFHEVWKGVQSKTIIDRGARYIHRKCIEFMGLNDYGTERTNRLVKRWLAENKNSTAPFYMFIHYIELHNPISAPYPFKLRYVKKNPHTVNMGKITQVAGNPLICFTDKLQLSEDEIEVLKALYDGEIAYLDQKIGELIEYLRSLNLYDNTFIVITSDHGEHFGEKGLYSHVSSLYEPIVHIPLILKLPYGLSRPIQYSGLVQLIDIVPTIMELADIRPDSFRELSGNILLPNGKTIPTHDFIFAEWEGRIPYFILRRVKEKGISMDMTCFTEKFWMMRDKQYKYIYALNGKEELYDLQKDKEEKHNIIKENNLIAKSMKVKLDQWRLTIGENTFVKTEYQMNEATRKNLESLGYL